MSRLTRPLIHGLNQQISNRLGRRPLMEPRPSQYHIIPWQGSQVGPTNLILDHGYSTFFNVLRNNLYIDYSISNAIDGYTYFKRDGSSYTDVLNDADMVLGPMQSGKLDLEGSNLAMVSACAGGDFTTQRTTISSSPGDVTTFNPRGPSAGLYFRPNDRPSLSMPMKYVRQYDIYDMNLAQVGGGNSITGRPTLAFNVPTSTFAGFNLRMMDGSGASGVQAGCHISVVTSGAGNTLSIALVKQIITSDGLVEVGTIYSTGSVIIGVGATVSIAPITQTLDRDLTIFFLASGGGAQITLDQLYANFTIS